MKTTFNTYRTAATLLFFLLLMTSWQGLFAQFYRGHSLYVCQSGSVRGFGYNDGTCQVGSGNPTPVSYPTPYTVINNTNAVSVAIGLRHSLSLLDDGTVLAWGNNTNGCTSEIYPTFPITCTPTDVTLPGCAVAISAGVNFSMALLADGKIWTWGSDNVGQLGNGLGNSTTNIPVQVSGITTAIAISAGAEHAIALLADGTVWAWGKGGEGQLGNGFTGNNFSPVQVLSGVATSLTNVVQIDAGSYHNIVLKSDNTVWTWGNNLDGQLGIGTYSQSNFAVNSSGLSSGTQIDIAAGEGFTMVLNNGGSTKVVGSNDRSRLGLNTPTSAPWPNTPITGPPITNAIDIVIPPNAMHGWAITSTGQVWSWGNNDNGAVGIGATPVTVDTPTLVSSNACTAAPSVSNRPQPCCVAVLEDERTVIGTNNGNVTFTTSQTYNNLNMAIFGTMTLNGGTHTFTSCDVVMGKDAKIIVNYPAQLIIQTGSHFYACSDMWDGIEVNNRAIVQVKTSCIIEDAEIAVDIKYGASYTLNNATFNCNYIHVRKTMPSTGTPYYTGDYRIVKCKFKCQTTASLGGVSVYTNLLPPRQNTITAIGIQAIGVPKLLVGNTLANANTFENSGCGTWAQTVPRVEVIYNTFRDMIQAGAQVWDGPGLGGETIRIAKNTLERMPFGIYCIDNPKATIKIDSNTVNFAGMLTPPLIMTGITVEELVPGNSTFPNKVRIFDNNVFNAPCGIKAVNLFGSFVPNVSTYIGENEITHTKIPNDAQSGILAQNVTGTVIQNNNVSHPTSAVNWWEAGIRVSGNNDFVMCNTTHHIGKGLFFDNDLRPNTKLVKNIMDQNQTGLFLNYAIIGAQGSTVGEPNDNEWSVATTWSAINPHIESFGSGANGALSPFHVQAPGAQFYPLHRTGTSAGVAVPTPTTTAKNWTLGCYFTPPSFKTGGENPALVEALAMVAEEQDALPQSLRESSMAWAGQYGLYKQLLADEELRYADDRLNAYFTEKEAGNMGLLTRAMAEFQAMRLEHQDDISVENISMVGSLSSELEPEKRLAEVLSILYANIADLNAVSDVQEERLREIAKMCPIDEGFGVYVARSALLKLDTLPVGYTSECEQLPAASKQKDSEFGGAESLFRIYPNPTNGVLSIDYTLATNEQGLLEVFDVVGSVVMTRPLKQGETNQTIDLTTINSGVYLVRILVNGEVRLGQKITKFSE